jgi:hypothetical protein
MDISVFNEKDLKDIKERGADPYEILKQAEIFSRGFSFANLLRPCRIGDGIKRLSDEDIKRLIEVFANAQSKGRVMKFVPASGAATRMFKELTSVNNRIDAIDRDYFCEWSRHDGDYRQFLEFVENLKKFPFYNELKSMMSLDGVDIDSGHSYAEQRNLLNYMLGDKGLKLAGLPKGLIAFHIYPDHARTPIEEHMVEARTYAVDNDGKARIHFTVSEEHEEAVISHVNKTKGRYESAGLHFEVAFSNQKPSTDTLAVNLDNTPFRDGDGDLYFRPAGHGALLANLSEIKGDIIFIKNIDNVAPDRLKETMYVYKKALGGRLVELQEKIFGYMDRLEREDVDDGLLSEATDFIKRELSVTPSGGAENLSRGEKIQYLVSRLNRPIRVCGMVRNQAEPGGGPFWVTYPDGNVSLQIVEKSQVDETSEQQKGLFKAATHFNPVDLVCGVRDHKGAPFDLNKYVDPEACFISIKSKDGKDLKALELPGLWNGTMAFWNTVFVEVPLITFNPVKTVFDLLRPEHQPE